MLNSLKTNAPKWIKSIAWLVETAARALGGYLIVVNNDHIVATIVGGYFLATAATMVIVHFFKANAK